MYCIRLRAQRRRVLLGLWVEEGQVDLLIWLHLIPTYYLIP